MRKILIVPVGKVDDDILRNISPPLEETFQCSVDTGEEMPVPQGSYNPKRRQYHSTAILKDILTFKKKILSAYSG
jgi:predicted Zn-dependent protease